MSFFSFFSKVSGWYRVLIATSIIWVIMALIHNSPLATHYSRGRRVTYGYWDDFLIVGILPIAILWGIIWIVHGFKKIK